MLQVKSLVKQFRIRTGLVEAVKGVSFTVASGEILAFLGPNGAGKTTTIKMTAGLIKPDQGSVFVDDKNLATERNAAVGKIGAVLEGSRNLYWRLTVMENLLYWGTMRRISYREARLRALTLLDQVGLTDRARSTVQTLSRGMQQKVALCQALMHRPSVLLLDEPTLGLDYESSEGIKRMVRELSHSGTAILLTTHQLDVAQELSDRVAMIRGGQLILEGTTQAILEKYSKPVYSIIAPSPWPRPLVAAAQQLVGEIIETAPDTLQFLPPDGDTDTIYRILSVLHPHPLLRVERHQADLTEVFQHVMTEGALA